MAEKMLPQIYRKDSQNLINFDYQDTLRGQAYIDFYAFGLTPQTESAQQYLITGDDENEEITGSGNKRMCQTFTLSQTTYITNIQVYGLDATGTNNIKISLEETTAGVPNGKCLAYGIVNFGGGVSWQKWILNSPVELLAGTYAIILNGQGNESGLADTIRWRGDGSAPAYAGGSYGSSLDKGVNWTMDATADTMFSVNGTTINHYNIFPDATETKYSNFIFPVAPLITTDTQIGEVNFELTAGRNFMVYGKALIEMKWILNLVNTAGATYTITAYLKAKLIKEHSAVETTLGTTATNSQKLTGTTAATTTRETLLIDCLNTSFNVGDKLKLSIEVWVSDFEEAAAWPDTVSNITLYFDPEDGTNKKDIKLRIPFKIT